MHHPLVVRRRFLQVLGVLSALATGGCAALQPGPRTVSISQEDLLQRLLAQFPLNRRLLEVFEVSLHSPQLRLIPAENRIGTELGYVIGARLPGARTTEGKLNLSYGLRFEPGDGTVRLSQVRQEGFDVPGVPQAYAAQATRLGSLLAAPASRLPEREGALHVLSLHVAEDTAPDLAACAAQARLAAGEFIRQFSAIEFTVAFLGFQPGFPYFTGLPEHWAMPRRASPRVRVPAGSVALGGGYAGVYPAAGPGGWHIVGQTDARLFDPARAQPALLAAGDRVRFEVRS